MGFFEILVRVSLFSFFLSFFLSFFSFLFFSFFKYFFNFQGILSGDKPGRFRESLACYLSLLLGTFAGM